MSHVVRLYAAVVTVLVFFVVWALVGAHPWTEPSSSRQDRRLAALAAREKALRARADEVKQVVDARWALYERRLRRRQAAIATAEHRHVAQLERAYAAALQAARTANRQAAEARSYAAQVLAWASDSHLAPAPRRSVVRGTAPPAGRTTPPPSAQAGASVPAPAAAPPPVAIVQLPPVTSTSSSKHG